MIDEAIERYMKGTHSEHDRKEFGQLVRESKDSPLYKLIKAVIAKDDEIESLKHSMSYYDTDIRAYSKTLIDGMKLVLLRLEGFVREEEALIAKEKEELQTEREEEENSVSYGEGVETADLSTLMQ